MPLASLYDDDILLWSEQQAQVIRDLAGRVHGLPNELDIENVAEEIESVGRSELSSVESQLRNILTHLVKISLSPRDAQVRRHWQAEVLAFHADLMRRFSPSMAQRVDLDRVWQKASEIALLSLPETNRVPRQPSTSPVALDQLLTEDLDVTPLVDAISTAFQTTDDDTLEL